MINGTRKLVGWAWLVLTIIAFTASVAPAPVLGGPLWFVALLASIVFHEGGHAIGALLVEWRVVVFSVWRLAYHVQNRQIAILDPDDLQERSGWVLAVPTQPYQNNPESHAAMAAGGPLASLLQAVLAFAYVVSGASGATTLGMKTEPLAVGFTLLGLGLFAATIVPYPKGEKANDGRILLDLFRMRREGETFPSLAWAGALLKCNVRLKDVPQWMLDDVDPDGNESAAHRQWLATIEIGRTLDRSPVDVALARTQIDRYWAAYEANDWLRACDAYLAAAHERDLEHANGMIEQLDDPSTLPQMEAAARAAAYQLAGNSYAAGQWLDRMDEIIAARSPFHDLTFRDIRARIEAISPLDQIPPAALRAPAVNA